MIARFFFFCLILAALTGCNGSIKQAFTTRAAPYEEYIKNLEKANLHETPMGQAWLDAGQRVFQDSIIVDLPFSESGYFSAAEPDARSYRFSVKEGQVLTVSGMVRAPQQARLFFDLFVRKNTEWDRVEYGVAVADSSFQLAHEFRSNQECLLRLQPELLINAYYTITISPTPVLINPVSGASNRSIGSLYGVDRDGGRRRHEGVDIFAPKGTPILAPTDGYVTRVNTTNLGGKVVWMQDRARGHAYYFAHLDSQMVQSGKRVMQGDTLGLVGNTGNARTTPPHLHFGIYQRGSIDPINYIRTLDAVAEASPLDTTIEVNVYRITAKQANLRSGPGEKQPLLGQLNQHTYVRIIGQVGNWYRIALPDNRQGYVSKRLVSEANSGKPLQLQEQKALLSQANINAIPITYLAADSKVEVLAQFEDYQLVQTKEGSLGWLLP